MNSPEKIVLWDFDGTLGYRDGIWSGPIIQVAEKASPGIDLSRELVHSLLKGLFPWNHPERMHDHIRDAESWWEGMYTGLARVYGDLGFTRNDADSLAREVRTVFCDPAGWHLFEDTIPILDELSMNGWGHMLLSNHVPELPQILDSLGITSRLCRVWNSAVTGIEKPNPAAFEAVLDELPGTATVVMVGDNPAADIEGARAVGLPAVLVRRETLGVEPFCACLTDLPPVLETIAGERERGKRG